MSLMKIAPSRVEMSMKAKPPSLNGIEETNRGAYVLFRKARTFHV
jgi:hypothetical protein